MKRKYSYYQVATFCDVETVEDYKSAFATYQKSEAPATLYGINSDDNTYAVIQSK